MAPRIVAGNLIDAIQKAVPDDEISLTNRELRRLEKLRLEYVRTEREKLTKKLKNNN